MFCFCRLVRHVLAAKSITNRTGAYFLQSLPSKHVHFQYSSKEYPENIFQEKGPLSELFRDVRSSAIIWKKQQNQIFQEFIKECFKKSDGSPSYANNLLRVACDNATDCSTDLISSLFLEFNRYLTNYRIEFVPTIEEQRDAMNCVLISRNYDILPLVCNVFKMNGKEVHIKKIVDELVEHQKLIEAAFCIGALNLQQEYEIEKVVLPLLLNGKVLPVTACLRNHPDLQLEVAKHLDIILATGRKRNVSAKDSKRAKKALDIFIKYFKISPEQCKNLFYIRGRSAINHLIKRRSQQSITQNTWEDMIMSILSDNPDLKEHLIYKLVQTNDKELALKMMEKLNMDDFDIESIPLAVNEEMLSLDDLEEGDEKTEETHLSLPLDISDIKFIDTEEKFSDFLNDIKDNYNILGIDSEWKPHFGLSKDRLSLIQIAVHDKAYILDVLSLSECLSTDHWDQLNEDIFGNPKIVKLGCDMLTDIQMIVNNNKGTTGKKIRFSHILDMVLFFERLQKTYPEPMKAEPQQDKNIMSLSKLCETVLGKPLNKEERLCDWEKRPLSVAQLGYAVLDAYCLLQVYDKLKEMSVEYNMNFELQAKNSMVLTAAQCKPRKGFRELRNEKISKFRKRIPIQQFKVAVSSELQQQGEHLKKLGADVLFHCKSLSPEDIVKIAENERRVVLCSEALHELIQHKISPWMCFKSPTIADSYITVSSMLQRFNVFIPSNAVSLCKVCNSNKALRLSPEHMNLLQNYIENKTLTESDVSEESDNFHQTLSNMRNSGIQVKFHNQNDSSLSLTSHKYFCTKCGTIQ